MDKVKTENKAVETKEMVLGSGDLYILKYTGAAIPADEALEVAENMIGGIKGGATLSYKPTIFSETDDMRRMKKSLVTAEEVIFKTGFLSFSLGEIAKLCLGSKLTSSESEDILEIGGGQSVDQYVLRFVHTTGAGKKIRVTLVGVPSAGFELPFSPEGATITNGEFEASPMPSGALVKISKEK